EYKAFAESINEQSERLLTIRGLMQFKWADAPIPIIVKLRRGPIARGEMAVLAEMQAEQTFELLAARAMQATPDMIAQLSDDPTVDLIWPDLPVHTWLDDAVPESPRWTELAPEREKERLRLEEKRQKVLAELGGGGVSD
ncbi:MAG: hypothetical protein HC800_19970, partial [Phormidesmis sp. RL_2_1]|nr:hypothetical protein [Phormidesmis sp. RL_2_1]